MSAGGGALPYRIAVLCYLRDGEGRLLLLHRVKPPNRGMYSPIGGKLETSEGESPHDCAVREIREEAGLLLGVSDVRLAGIVSETAYEGDAHWLLFLFEVTRPVAHDEVHAMHIDEGALEWIREEDVASLEIPETDRRVLWPLVREHRGRFFVVHIDCRAGDLRWRVVEE